MSAIKALQFLSRHDACFAVDIGRNAVGALASAHSASATGTKIAMDLVRDGYAERTMPSRKAGKAYVYTITPLGLEWLGAKL